MKKLKNMNDNTKNKKLLDTGKTKENNGITANDTHIPLFDDEFYHNKKYKTINQKLYDSVIYPNKEVAYIYKSGQKTWDKVIDYLDHNQEKKAKALENVRKLLKKGNN